MALFKAYKKADDGVWIEFEDGCNICLRPFHHPLYKSRLRELAAPYQRELGDISGKKWKRHRPGGAPEEKDLAKERERNELIDRLITEAAAETLVLNWKNVEVYKTNEAGEFIPNDSFDSTRLESSANPRFLTEQVEFSIENCKLMFEKYPEFKELVLAASQDEEMFRQEIFAEQLGNS